MNFIRFGNLNLVKQTHYVTNDDNKTFHNAPTRYGIYAFPEQHIELFLVGKEYFDGRIHEIIKRNVIYKDFKDYKYDGFLVFKKEPFDQYNKTDDELRENTYLVRRKRPKKFNYDGNIWHHLNYKLKKEDIIKQSGSWVYTTMKVYKKQFSRACGRMYCGRLLKGISYSKDHMEVFISDKI